MMTSVQGVRMVWPLLVVLAIVSPLISLWFGSADLPDGTVWACLTDQCPRPVDQAIFYDLRLPRVLAALLVGGGLAVAGASLQNVTRNGLADPYLFGVVAGAGLGASIVSVLPGVSSWVPDGVALPMAAFIGSSLAVVLVQALATSAWARTPEQLLLAGVAVSLMLGAMTHFVLYLGEPFAANKVMFWLMGSLSRVELHQLAIMALPLLVAVALLWLLGRRFDAMLLGDDTARSLGVEASTMRAIGMVICAGLTAVVVAYCGGIGFVGLMIPHIVRRWVGVSTRQVVPASLLLGGAFLVWADVLARSASPDHEIPIGILTSAIGSVFFLLMMRRR
ncbi:FecCD family ABC transporter permease [Oceanobacter kriegii]|uniref:FecCD family ABC transporter permease n=1 Tax=Oceanobacter kriegii TaxID=64972 RepID=UPI000419406A|nr:iron ABC transporter permease [Oceanobacter kriegii]